jgi:hypothetical protein
MWQEKSRGRDSNPALLVWINSIRKLSVIPLHPNPSLRIVSWGLAILIMSCDPTPPLIVMTGDPHSFPGARDPFTSHFPMARNIFLSRWIIIRLRYWRDQNWRRRGKSG